MTKIRLHNQCSFTGYATFSLFCYFTSSSVLISRKFFGLTVIQLLFHLLYNLVILFHTPPCALYLYSFLFSPHILYRIIFDFLYNFLPSYSQSSSMILILYIFLLSTFYNLYKPHLPSYLNVSSRFFYGLFYIF